MSIPILPRLTALTLGAVLLLSPAAALTPAVSAPAPASLAVDLVGEYERLSALVEGMGLTLEQKHVLWSRLDNRLLSRLETGSLSTEELRYLTLPHFRSGRAERYAAWATRNPDLAPDRVVTEVNMDRDQDFYGALQPVSHPQSLLVLVNKHYALASDYVPELEVLGSGYGKGSLQPEAARQFRAMADAAQADGISLRSVSAYRSYATQRYTYNHYLTQYSQRMVDDFSARPGHSEHQTGLALDINVARTAAHFENTAVYAWLQEHCAQYGFLLRYPKGKEHITGYRFEPWHYRYVGTEVASVCMEQGLTYEEYTAQLPAEELRDAPALVWRGRFLDLEGGALVLEGQTYLSAARFARALGLEADQTGSSLTLGGTLSFCPGLYARRNGAAVRLTSPALFLDGEVYLTPGDLAALLGLAVASTPFGLEFSLT